LPLSSLFTWENAKNYGIPLLIVILVILLIVGAIILCYFLRRKTTELDPSNVEEGIRGPYGYESNYDYDRRSKLSFIDYFLAGPLPMNFARGITTLGSSFARKQPDTDGKV
jgi:hypothetical protein